MRVYEAITYRKWVDGSGWAYESADDGQYLDIESIGAVKTPNWDWYVIDDGPYDPAVDIQIEMAYYQEDVDWDADPTPLVSHKIWESELRRIREENQ